MYALACRFNDRGPAPSFQITADFGYVHGREPFRNHHWTLSCGNPTFSILSPTVRLDLHSFLGSGGHSPSDVGGPVVGRGDPLHDARRSTPVRVYRRQEHLSPHPSKRLCVPGVGPG